MPPQERQFELAPIATAQNKVKGLERPIRLGCRVALLFLSYNFKTELSTGASSWQENSSWRKKFHPIHKSYI